MESGSSGRKQANTRSQSIERRKKLLDGAVIFIILVSLGFPGQYTRLLGGASSTLMEYGSFGLQLFIMLFADRRQRGVLGVRVMDLKPRYGGIYLMAVVFFADSMLATRYPSEQLISCVRFTVTILFALWMTDHYSAEEILDLICKTMMVFVALTAVYCVLFPGTIYSREQGEHDFIGMLKTKNNQAAVLSLGMVFHIIRFKLKRAKRVILPRRELALFMLQLIMLAACNAKGALFCAAIPLGYLLFVEERLGENRRLPLGVVYIVGSVGFVIFALTILPLFEPVLALFGKNATLTGRVPLWRQIIKVASENKTFTGYGFGMFWRDATAVAKIHSAFRSTSFMGQLTTGAHNVLLEYWLNVGLLGLGAYFIALLASFAQVRRLERENYLFCAAYMLWFMVMGWTERSMTTFGYQMLFLFLAMGLGCHRKKPVSRRAEKMRGK